MIRELIAYYRKRREDKLWKEIEEGEWWRDFDLPMDEPE